MDANVNAKPHAHIVFSEYSASGEMTVCAYLDLRNPAEFVLEKDQTGVWLTLAIEAGLMDELALSWCRQRKLACSAADITG